MAQKVNPISLRLDKTNRTFDSSWFNNSNYTYLLKKDIKIQSYVNVILKQIKYSSARYLILNLPNKTKINVFFYNPNKNRRNTSKIFYLNNKKKNKKLKKNFLNKKYAETSIKQNRVFQFLSLNFKNEIFNYNSTNKQNFNLPFNRKNTYGVEKITLLHLIKKLNTFLMKYFLVKYFSLKNNYVGLHLKENILFNYTMNFVIFQIYKKKMVYTVHFFQSAVQIYKKSMIDKQNESFYKANSIQNEDYKNLNKNKFILNSNSVLDAKLGILNNLHKIHVNSKLQEKQFNIVTNSYNYLNKFKKNYTNLEFFNEYKFLCAFNNFLDSTVNEKLKKKFMFVEENDFNKKIFSRNNQRNQNYYNISIINNQCFNKTYKIYCNLSESYKYYNFIFFKNKNTNINNECKTFFNNVYYRNSLLIANPLYKNHMESIICNNYHNNVELRFFKTTNMFTNALFLINEIVYYIEKKVPFFKIKNYILRLLTQQKSIFLNVKGIRIMCSGRIGGKSKKAQRSKIQNFKYGETSLHVFSSKIDFQSKKAFTSFGTLGVKIWVCYQ